MRMGTLHKLTIVFIALKLFGLISWSWWFVIAPSIIHVIVAGGLYLYWVTKIFYVVRRAKRNKELKHKNAATAHDLHREEVKRRMREVDERFDKNFREWRQRDMIQANLHKGERVITKDKAR